MPARSVAAAAKRPASRPVKALAGAHRPARVPLARGRRAIGAPRVAVSVERRPGQVWVRISSRSPLPRHSLWATGRAGDVALSLPGRAGGGKTVVVAAGGVRRVVAGPRRGQFVVTVERDAIAGYRSAYTPNRRELVLEVDMGAAPQASVLAPASRRQTAPAVDADPVVPLPLARAAQLAPAPARAASPLRASSAPSLAAQPRPRPVVAAPPARAAATAPRAAAMPAPRAGIPRVVAALPGTWRVLGAQEAGQKLVTLDFVGADIQDVLKALAIQSGTNILVAPKVEGKVTVGLRGVAPEQALEYVVRLAGLAYGQEDGTYVVCPRDQIKDLFPAGTRGRILFPPPAAEEGGPGVSPQAAERKFVTVRLEKLDAKDVVPFVQKIVPGMEVQAPDTKILMLVGVDQQITAAQAAITALEAAAPEPATRDAGVPPAQLGPTGLRDDVKVEVYSLRHVSAADAGKILDMLMAGNVLPRVVVTPAPAPAYPVVKGSGAEGSKTYQQQLADPSQALLNLLYGPGRTPGATGEASPTSGQPEPPGGGSTVAIPAGTNSNTLLLIGAAEDIVEVRKQLAVIDVGPKQVMIDLKVTDVSLTDEQRLGVSWNWGTYGLQELVPTGAGGAAGEVVPELQLGRFGHAPVGFNATLEAMLKTQKARLLANPRVAVLDGNEARIHVGDTIRYLAQRTSGINGTSVTIGSADVGVLVEVTPRIGGDGVIILNVRPKVNVIVGFTSTGDGGQVPNTSERSVETVVRMRDGDTLAIGGLIRDEDSVNMEKIPGLGDLPLVGQLFKFRNRQRRNSEVLIFITATLVPEPTEP